MGFPLKEITLGFIPASRGSFSAELAAKVRGQTLKALKKTGVRVVVPSEQQTRAGCVQSLQEAETCAELFRQQRVQGILVGAGNFGEEQAVAWTVRKAGLNVPVMIFGCQEEETLTRKTVAAGLLLRAAVDRRRAAADRREIFGGPAADLLPLRCLVRGRPGLVRSRLPRGRRRAERPLCPDRRPARRLLDLPLQREATPAAGSDGRGARPFGSHRRRQGHGRRRSRGAKARGRHRPLRRHVGRHARGRAAQRQVGAVPAAVQGAKRHRRLLASSAGPRCRRTTACAVARP